VNPLSPVNESNILSKAVDSLLRKLFHFLALDSVTDL
jgi:hypothetical protein